MIYQSKHNVQYTFIDDLNIINAELPNTKNLFRTARFMQVNQEIISDIHHHLVLVKQNDKLIGQLYFQRLPFKGKELASYREKNADCLFGKTIESLLNIALEQVHWNIVVLGNVFITGDSGQEWFIEIKDSLKWRIISEVAELQAKKQNADAILITEINEENRKDIEILFKEKYREFEVEPDLKFNIPPSWKTFDDYLSSLSSKYRVRTKKVLEKSKHITIQELNNTAVYKEEDKLYELYKNVMQNARFKLAEVPTHYFSKMLMTFPNKFHIYGFYLEDELLGFSSSFENDSCLNINFVGIDYTQNRTYRLYHRMLYHCIEIGLSKQKQSIHFGRTATEIKTSIGAIPVPSYSYIKHQNKLPNMAIKPLTNIISPLSYVKRNPFKEPVHTVKSSSSL